MKIGAAAALLSLMMAGPADATRVIVSTTATATITLGLGPQSFQPLSIPDCGSSLPVNCTSTQSYSAQLPGVAKGTSEIYGGLDPLVAVSASATDSEATVGATLQYYFAVFTSAPFVTAETVPVTIDGLIDTGPLGTGDQNRGEIVIGDFSDPLFSLSESEDGMTPYSYTGILTVGAEYSVFMLAGAQAQSFDDSTSSYATVDPMITIDGPNASDYYILFSPGLAVPETSAWALMLVGFAGLGMAMRRREIVEPRRPISG
jgi:hypothetical protein